MTLFAGSDNWRSAMQDVARAIDDTQGELVTVMPFTVSKVNYPSVPDRSKPVVTVTAVFRNKAKMIGFGEGSKFGGHVISPVIESSEPIFEFSYGVLRSIPYPLDQYYRIERCCNAALYEITNIKPDGVSRTCVNVKQLGRPMRED